MLDRLVGSQMHPSETRKLSTDELTTVFRPILDQVRLILLRASNGDSQFHWALRRKLAKELVYDEREKPAKRKRLKRQKRRQQGDKCQNCRLELPQRGAVLDRLDAMKGYTLENTRLLCPRCDLELQVSRGYK
jgi:hypothetical protein